jgi:hypothetical protein
VPTFNTKWFGGMVGPANQLFDEAPWVPIGPGPATCLISPMRLSSGLLHFFLGADSRFTPSSHMFRIVGTNRTFVVTVMLLIFSYNCSRKGYLFLGCSKPGSLNPRPGEVAQDFLPVDLDPRMKRVGRLAELAWPNGDHHRMADSPAPEQPAERHGAGQAFGRNRQAFRSPFDIGHYRPSFVQPIIGDQVGR